MLLPAKSLKNKILNDPYNALVFKKGKGKTIYVVGGHIRDLLRGMSSLDRDYLIDDDIKGFAREITGSIGGTIVEFRKDHMARVAFKEGLTLDFSKPEGTIIEDLSKRDFTINAIAWSPDTGILDPFNGLQDIKKKIIRSIAIENLKADPLRMLRAYRFASELNGRIEKNTRQSIKKLYKSIRSISPERITLELFHLLNSENPSKYLKMVLVDRVLSYILFLSYSKLEKNIKAISRFEILLKRIPLKLKVELKTQFSQNLTYKGLLVLEFLLRYSRLEPFAISSLRMSNSIVKRIILTHKGLKSFEEDNLFDLFMRSGEASRDILILKGRLDLLKDYERFKKIWRHGLLSSQEISEIAKVGQSPALGRIIFKFKKAQFERLFRSKDEARRFIYNLT